MDVVLTIVYTILILLVLIFVHETGHLIAAKLTGVRVNEFALGMGPKLFGFVRGETQYSFRAIPVGGYCAMEGEDAESEDPRAFGNKPARMRAFVLFAGSLMNVLLAIIILSMLTFYIGEPTRVLATVSEQSPAYAAGLRPGDELLSINDRPVSAWNDVTAIITGIANENGSGSDTIALSLEVLRDGSERTIETRFFVDEDGILRIGITAEHSRSVAFFLKSFVYGAQDTVLMCRLMYGVIGDLFTQKLGFDQLTSFIGIGVTVGEVAQYGFASVIQLAALISLNLGIVNLLPFPALDGGRLLFLLIRKITGKAISDTVEGRVHLIGIIVLFGFMALITLQDIDRFFIQ